MHFASILPEAGPAINALATVSKFIGITASIAVVGSLLSAGFFLEDEKGRLTSKAFNFAM